MKHSHYTNKMYSTIIWTLSLILADGILCKTTVIEQQLNLTKYCPKTNFCTQRASSNFSSTGKQSCCSSCLCTDDCHMYGNCCPDFEHQVDIKYSMPECFFPVYNINFETQDFYNNYIFTGINSYNAFIKCPETYKNDTVRDMCEGIPNHIEDFALVSNEQGYVYKNKHCAHCHGVDKFLSWSLKIKCLTSEDAEYFQNTLPIVKNDTCMIWSFPKKAEVGRQSLCFKAYDSCEVHGSLRNACQSYTLYYFYNVRGVIILFRNVHCYACKYPQSSTKMSCALMTTEAAEKLYPSFMPVAALLDIDFHRDAIQPSKLSKVKICSMLEVYDAYFEKCRILKCPVLSTALHGKCISYFNNVFGFSVGILVEFQPISKKAEFKAVKTAFDQSELSKLSNFYTKIVATILNSTKPYTKECGICESEVLENGTLMYLKIAFHTNTKCNLNDLYLNLYKYAQGIHRFNIRIQRKTFVFTTRVKFNKFETIHQMTFRFTLRGTICDNPILFNGDLTCPKITLNKTEYHILEAKGDFHGKVLGKEIVHFPNDIESIDKAKTILTRNVYNNFTQEFDVCLNDYNKFINSGSTISKFDWLSIISAAIHALLIFICPLQ